MKSSKIEKSKGTLDWVTFTIKPLRRARHSLGILAVLLVCFFAIVPEAAADYAVENLASLGSVGGSQYNKTNGFNSLGQLIGRASFSRGSHPFFHDGTTLHNLGIEDITSSYPLDLNDAGQVLCQTSDYPNQTVYLWTETGGIVNLGSIGYNTMTYGNDLNGSGHVVGVSRTNNNYHHAFIWTKEDGMRDLGVIRSDRWWENVYEYSSAQGINESGQVYGPSTVAKADGDGNWVYTSRAFVWTEEEGMLDLGTLPGFYATYPIDQNESGQVIGTCRTIDNVSQPFIWTRESGMVEIGMLGGRPNRLNESGQVVGRDQNSEWVWTEEHGTVTIAAQSNGGYQNEAGQIAGSAQDANGDQYSYIWSRETGIMKLGSLGGQTRIEGINEAGMVIGMSRTADEEDHAFLWTEAEGMVDLNDLIISTAPAGLVLESAVAISDNGKIAAKSNAGIVLLSSTSATPTIGPITLDNDLVAAGMTVSAGVSFLDENTSETHTAKWNWGDGTPVETGTVSEEDGSGTVSGSHSYAESGIYSVSVKVTDNSGLSATIARDIVVYDPSAGFVTGGGWIYSPSGAYKEDEGLTGKATFGFVSKYKKGASVPTGSTTFYFHAGDLNFYSDSYDWLVIAGAKAMYKGEGYINGEGPYKFILTAIDADLNTNDSFSADRFRIKIWYDDAELEEEVTVYDNQIEAVDEDSPNEGTELGGGSIKIHKK